MFRLRGDNAQDLTGRQIQQEMAEMGIVVTSTAGSDPNANQRAQRAVRWLKDKVRTLLVNNVRYPNFNVSLKDIWAFAAQHATEVHQRDYYDDPECKHEFASVVFSALKDLTEAWQARYRKTLFMGFAPNVTHGYFVMHSD